MNLEFFYGF